VELKELQNDMVIGKYLDLHLPIWFSIQSSS